MGASHRVDQRPADAVTAPPKKIDWAHELKQAFWLVLAVLGVHSFIAKPFYIPSESMLPGLLVGDRLIVSKYPYGYSYLSPSVRVLPQMKGRLFGSLPTRGDIIVVKAPVTGEDWIKRVIGLPGDTVQMKGGELWLNGEPVARVPLAPAEVLESPNSSCALLPYFRATNSAGQPVCRYPRFRETLPGGVAYDTLDLGQTEQDDTLPILVPEGQIFVMGDNRDNSRDSRFSPDVGGLGLLPVENIVGRAEFITFSLDGSASLFNPLSWPGAFRPGRAGESLRPEGGQ